MTPERLTFFTEQSELGGKDGFDRVEILADVLLPDFLKAVSGRGFTRYEHVFSKNPGDHGNLGVAIGRVREVYSDGWLSSLGHHMRYEGKGFRFFHPVFEDASYFAHVKTPPQEGEDLMTNEEVRDIEVMIVSNNHAKDIRRMFKKAGIDPSFVRFAKGNLS